MLRGRPAADPAAARVIELPHSIGQAVLGRRFGRVDGLHFSLDGLGEELAEAAVRLEVPPDHDRVVGFERLRDPIDERPREPQRVPDFPNRRPGPIRDQVADHAGVLGAVAPVDVLDDFLPTFR